MMRRFGSAPLHATSRANDRTSDRASDRAADGRAQVALRLLTEFREVAAVDVIRAVSDCDRQWPSQPGVFIERAARRRLRASA